MKQSDMHIGQEVAVKFGRVARKAEENLDFVKATVIEKDVDAEKRVYAGSFRGHLSSYSGIKIRLEEDYRYGHDTKAGSEHVVEGRQIIGDFAEEDAYRTRVREAKEERRNEAESTNKRAEKLTEALEKAGIEARPSYPHRHYGAGFANPGPTEANGVVISLDDVEQILKDLGHATS